MTEQTILHIRTYIDHAGLYTIEQIAAIVGAPRTTIERVVEEQIIVPSEQKEMGPLFHADQLREFERMLRLHEDLGVNWAGVAIIHNLLERVERLEKLAERRAHGDGDPLDADCS